jgi:ATP-dependent RNA helicase HelY
MIDFPQVVEVVGTIRVPKQVDHRSPQERRDLASSIRALHVPEPSPRGSSSSISAGEDAEVVRLRRALRAHPCHACPDREQHARIGERHARLSKENDGLRRRIEGRTGSLGRMFDQICELLSERGYLVGDETTANGRQLARLWSESDLLAAECLRDGAWDRLDAAELAAAVSTLVYEPRRDEAAADVLPTPALNEAMRETSRIWAQLRADEEERGLPVSRAPEVGFMWVIYRWARQDRLDRVLDTAAQRGIELSAGDFIRWCKQVIDLLDQLSVAPGPTPQGTSVSRTARAAVDAIRRGVVAQSMQR